MNSLHTNFTAQEICDIIKACGESGVVKFECGPLCLSFQDSLDQVNTPPQNYSPGQVAEIPKVMNESSLIKQDEMSVKEEHLAELKLQDPYEYETLLAEPELVGEE